jgi:hypothetical protein
MDHAARHWDSVLHDLIGDAELLERVNSPRGKRQINRAAADQVTLARISPTLVKFHLVSAPAKVGGEQSAG